MKLSAKVLKQLVQEELGRFGKVKSVKDVAKKTKEVDADEYADTLEKQVDQMKALKIEEGKLKARLRTISERKAKLAKLIAGE